MERVSQLRIVLFALRRDDVHQDRRFHPLLRDQFHDLLGRRIVHLRETQGSQESREAVESRLLTLLRLAHREAEAEAATLLFTGHDAAPEVEERVVQRLTRDGVLREEVHLGDLAVEPTVELLLATSEVLEGVVVDVDLHDQ